MVSLVNSDQIPMVPLMRDSTQARAFGLETVLNDAPVRLEIDTGVHGLVVNRSVAKRAGLTRLAKTHMQGVGSEGRQAGYMAYVDSIHIGKMEFQNCTVRVIDNDNLINDVDGLIGMDVFSPFLVTLDFPVHNLLLGPLPNRPGETAADSLRARSGISEAETVGDGATVSELPGDEEFDRYIAPEMKAYTMVYRVGHNLILPAALNGKELGLFVIDTGSWTTTITPQAAAKVAELHGADVKVHGMSGRVDKVYSADHITFRFANLQQKVNEVVAFDTSNISRDLGLEISGFLGATTLEQLTIHMDYRDGLVKFDYDPTRENGR